MSSPDQKPVSLKTSSLFRDVELRIGGIRIGIPQADYQAMLHEIDRELASRNLQTEHLGGRVSKQWKEVRQAVDDLREILYTREGDYFILRNKPDEKLLDVFLEKYAALMGFE